MSIDAVILRMSVDEYEELSSPTADATHVYTSCCSCRYSVAVHRTTGNHHSRHLLHDGGEYGSPVVLGELSTTDDIHRHREIAHVGNGTCTGNDNLVK